MTPEEYEQGFAKEIASFANLPGWKAYLVKADRGEQVGKFALLVEIESIESRDRYYPRENEESEEGRRFWEEHPDSAAVLEKYAAFLFTPHRHTDYVVLGT